eukprot:scaffold8374_cov175-Amphora_coffeaeformis.AAC.4
MDVLRSGCLLVADAMDSYENYGDEKLRKTANLIVPLLFLARWLANLWSVRLPFWFGNLPAE